MDSYDTLMYVRLLGFSYCHLIFKVTSTRTIFVVVQCQKMSIKNHARVKTFNEKAESTTKYLFQ